MKWIKDVLEKHIGEDGVIDLEAAESELNTEAPKNVIPKEQYNSKVEELNQTKATLDEIQEGNKDNEGLQAKIDELNDKLEEAEQEKAEQAKEYALKSALSDVGAIDVDYFADKLKTEVELDEEGNLTGFDEKVKEYQTRHPKLFASADDKQGKDKNGFNVLDNKLDGGDPSPKLTKREIYEKYPKDKEKRIELLQELEGE